MAANFVQYLGETGKGLKHKQIYEVEWEHPKMGLVWLKNESGGITLSLSKEVKTAKQPTNGKGLEFGKPKPRVEVSDEQIDAAISSNEIYRRVRAELNAPQREQVGYGVQKYPELLNADTWTILETIKHIKGELIDALHYLTMFEIKLEQSGENHLPK